MNRKAEFLEKGKTVLGCINVLLLFLFLATMDKFICFAMLVGIAIYFIMVVESES